MQFEWDERKWITNLEKHSLDFFDATVVFENPHVIAPSTNSDEPRFVASACCKAVLSRLFIR